MVDIRTNKLSVYLIKDEFTDQKAILKKVDKLKTKPIGGIGTFYYGKSHTIKPSWIEKFFGSSLDNVDLFNANSKGILLISIRLNSVKSRIFAIPFGYGWTLLNPGTWEERFGLKVTLNILDPKSLRRIDKQNMASVPKNTNEQLSRVGVAADFGIDIEQDLVRSITGRPQVECFGKTVTGKDALSVSVRVNLSNVKEFLKLCYEKYESNDYKENFGWIDQITEVRDRNKVTRLDNQLIRNITDSSDRKTWMAVPELVDWSDISGFAYKSSGQSTHINDIQLSDFLRSLSQAETENLGVDTLKKKEVYCFSASSGELKHHWKAYNCLYCEIHDDQIGKIYVLNNGKWYEVEGHFTNQVNSDYRNLRSVNSSLLLPAYTQLNENEYNKQVAVQNQNICCMDRKNISHGGGYSKIEFCDLFTKDKKTVHVKHYGASSVLSYLFSQGVVSGELFIADVDFRKKVNDQLPASHKISDIENRPIAAIMGESSTLSILTSYEYS